MARLSQLSYFPARQAEREQTYASIFGGLPKETAVSVGLTVESFSRELHHLDIHEQSVSAIPVIVVTSGSYSPAFGRTKVPRTARWSDGYAVMAISVFGFVSSIPTVTASIAVTPVPL